MNIASRRNDALLFVIYLGLLLLGCKSGGWKTQPAQPPAAVEQKTSVESLRQKAVAARGSVPEALAYAHAVAEHLEGGGTANAEADPGQALELLDAGLQANPLQGAEIQHARGRVEFGLRDYEVAVATYEANARDRGFAPSATEVVRFHAAAGNREDLQTFCNDTFGLIRGGDEKNVFVSECVAGMGYASPAEWSLMSKPAVVEYERWRSGQAQAERDQQAQKAAQQREQRDQAAAAHAAETNKKNCVLRCAEKEALCKSNCYDDQCRRDCSDAEWACRRQC